METIHPLELGALIETSKPIGIIDLRARVEFEKLHIKGAHSLPLPELAPETLKSLRELPSAEPFYLISASGKLASSC
jgi:rhodanese-related sulfurtransferase